MERRRIDLVPLEKSPMFRAVSAALLAVASLACTQPSLRPVEICDNGLDDDGNSKTDCADPACFFTPACAIPPELCGNGLDDDRNGKVDCADPACASFAACIVPTEVCGNGADDDGDGKVDCADSDCAGALGCPLVEICNNGLDDDGNLKVDCLDPACASVASCQPELCANRVDDDLDGKIDCADPDCEGSACGTGCKCAATLPVETLCADGLDNDGDGAIDCSDSKCSGVGPEICDDGIDNNCDHRVDCLDPTCAGSAACRADGAACTSDLQCQGGKCLTEAATGSPLGACSNAVSCGVSPQTGCHGGICVESGGFDVCRQKCVDDGSTGTRCRPGYACHDPDLDNNNNNNHCMALCGSDSDCGAGPAGYGCNPWSRRCGQKDKALPRYGAPCSADSQCESGKCSTGKPGGYCLGFCSGTAKACATGGLCYYYPDEYDNTGLCIQACASAATCRGAPYTCQDPGQGSACWCLPKDAACNQDSDCCGTATEAGNCGAILFHCKN